MLRGLTTKVSVVLNDYSEVLTLRLNNITFHLLDFDDKAQ